MALSSPPPAPQRGDRATFSQRVDAFLLWLTGIIPQLNAFISSITTLAAGGANSFSYTFDTATADADPGTGKLRLGSAPQNGAVVMRIGNAAGSGGDISGFLASLAAGTSNVKGSVRLQRVNDVSAWLLFDVTAVATPSGYANLTLTPRASSSASPFANNDTLMVFFDKQGDRGTSGGTPTSQEIRDAVGTLPVENGGTGGTTAAVARANLGLGNVDNTSDAAKPVSTAQDAALALKLDKSGGDVTGGITLSHTKAIYGRNTSATPIYLLGVASDNNIYSYSAAPSGQWRWMNFNGNTNVATLTDSGAFSAVSLSATSDENLKGNWRALPDKFLENFAAIERAGLFDWQEDKRTDGGVGAQSIQKIAPWCVTNVNGVLHVNYGALAVTVSHALTRRVLRNEGLK